MYYKYFEFPIRISTENPIILKTTESHKGFDF